MIKLDWEGLGADIYTTERAKVHGGWLVRTNGGEQYDGRDNTLAMTFVPDPDHKWGEEDA